MSLENEQILTKMLHEKTVFAVQAVSALNELSAKCKALEDELKELKAAAKEE